MNFKFTEEEEAFRKEVRDFIHQELPADWEGHGFLFDFPDQYWDFRMEMMKKLRKKGWEHGGKLSEIEYLILTEEAAYWGAPGFSGSNFSELLITKFGNEEQQKYWLPIVTEENFAFCGMGLSEPNAGSDLASLQTRAVRDGDYYVINGQKTWQTDAHHVSYTALLVRTDPNVAKHKGLSMFLVDMKLPGITIEPLKNCYGDEIFADVFYDNVRVPAISLIGGENNGWKVVNGLLITERGGIDRVAASKRMLDEIVKYTKEAKRNGKPLAENPTVRQKIAQLAIEIEVGRWLCYRIAWMINKGMPPDTEVSIAKL